MDKRIITGAAVFALAVLAAVWIGLFGLPGQDQARPDSSENKREQRPMIGVSIDSMVIERWHRDVDIIKTRAVELGYDVEVVNSYEDSDKQEEQIRSLIEEGAGAIMIIPKDKDNLAEVVKEAKREGIIVISYDRLIVNADVDAYVSFDNYAVGIELAKGIVSTVPEGNYLIVNGAPEDNNASMVHQGLHEVLDPYIEAGDIRVLEEIWAPNWREEFAYNLVSKTLQEGQGIDGILCANDLLAEGAISALAEYRLAGEVAVVGQDANISACQRVVEGKQLMTVYKPLKTLAEGAVDLVDDMLKSGRISSEETINDGTYEVPYVSYEVVPVFKENMRDTVIKDFFHSEEDVYINQ